MSGARKTDKEPTFEQDLARLEEIIEKLEEGGESLDESLKLFEEGQVVLVRCRKVLDKAQVRVRKLLENGTSEEIDPEALGR
ncbi:MAG: exodeoxyribonuclease VII small subunit [bacterium]